MTHLGYVYRACREQNVQEEGILAWVDIFVGFWILGSGNFLKTDLY